MTEKKIEIRSISEAQRIFGTQDENIKIIEKKFGVKVVLRGEYLKIKGGLDNVKQAGIFIESLLKGIDMTKSGMSKSNVEPHNSKNPGRLFHHLSLVKSIGPKTKGQQEYFDAIKKHDIVFGIGPAGTGKTYLAMCCAVEALKNQAVRRIILTRPAIEAGESLGYLPGDMYEKISPYLRPLYDALYDMMDAAAIEKYLETGIIEVAPLAYMRGRTLNDAFIILDEAQNATQEQMKMFLTRLGFDSKAVITGDITQSDLPGGRPQGLLSAIKTIENIPGIKIVKLGGQDVVRHELVQKIIEAYEKISYK